MVGNRQEAVKRSLGHSGDELKVSVTDTSTRELKMAPIQLN